jgi:TetR/AcrR family transcriptional repressor of nem operon
VARPKEFDREEALRKATEVFWLTGYEATSVGDLARAMGIGRQSLYDTFGDKHALFTQALELYKREQAGIATRVLAEAVKPLDAIKRLFHSVADMPPDLKKRGCLMVNTTMEVCPRDAAVTRLVCENQRVLRDALRSALVRAKKEGDLPAGADPDRLSRYLVTSLQGLHVAAKTEPDPAPLHDIADHMLRVLER